VAKNDFPLKTVEPKRHLETEMRMKRILIVLFALLVLTACSANSPESIQGQWQLVSHGPASGQAGAAPDVDASIEFGADGQLSGNVGCNGFGGEYTVEGNVINFGPIISTKMFCDGPVGEQEATTLAVLSESATFSLEGDTLTITSADGNSAIVLER
jgi:heat shock protein HslJ